MQIIKPYTTMRTASKILWLLSIAISGQANATDLVCSGPQMGELFIDTTAGKVTKSAEESLTVTMTTENTHYGFSFKGKSSKFKATINRANGQIIMDEACTPECWGGPIFGNCATVKAKL